MHLVCQILALCSAVMVVLLQLGVIVLLLRASKVLSKLPDPVGGKK